MYSAYMTEVCEDLKENLIKSLEFIDWKKHVKRDSTVFIKPIVLIEYGYVEEEGRKAKRFVEKYKGNDIVAEFEGILEGRK